MIIFTRQKPTSKLPVRLDKLNEQLMESIRCLMSYETHKVHTESAIDAYNKCLEHLNDPLYDDTRSRYTVFWIIRSLSVAECRDREAKKIRARLFQLEMDLEDFRFRIESTKARIHTLKKYLSMAEDEVKAEARKIPQTPISAWSSRSRKNRTPPVEVDLTANLPGPVTGFSQGRSEQ